MTDHVDLILKQWGAERPDLDASPMGVVGRLSRLSRQIDRELEQTFLSHGLDAASFDVLATLRRSGQPYTLTPRELTASSMVTSSAIAQRLNRLEERRLVARAQDPGDGRGKQVALTAEGLTLIDAALPDHLETERRILSPLSPEERDALAVLLTKLSAARG
ncbi:MarR family winged helix-turn-helix transcriptional regulator [Arthrobacter sp. CAN_A1]|uniref:MarR family winged helix-turn-helix transcriptional regulator n=1 Tax=Arthrobacter sp. CAN_A1 TaxID=2787717 RepID=UPI0018C9FCAD